MTARSIVEAKNCIAFGWAVDHDDRQRDLEVRILSDDDPVPVVTAVADLLREDVSDSRRIAVQTWPCRLITPSLVQPSENWLNQLFKK
jgi:hypothetical protein